MRFALLAAAAALCFTAPANAARYVQYRVGGIMTGVHNNYPSTDIIPSAVHFLFTVTIDTLTNPTGVSSEPFALTQYSAGVSGDTFSLSYGEVIGNSNFFGSVRFGPGVLNGQLPQSVSPLDIVSTTARSNSSYVHYFDSYSGNIDRFTVAAFDEAPVASGVVLTSWNTSSWSGVPEPASWAMMIAGFGTVGGAMRRRSKTRDLYA